MLFLRAFSQETKNTTAAFTKNYNTLQTFTKKSTKNPSPFFYRFYSSCFWAFLGEGSKKTPQAVYAGPALFSQPHTRTPR
jgi:hypothetical protein